MRVFGSGASRDDDNGKLEPWGFTSALTEKAFSEYMHAHRMDGGELRASNNWTRGIPLDAYWHSLSRHIQDFRLIHEGFPGESRAVDIEEALCGIIFNAQGYLYEVLKVKYGAQFKKD